MKGYILLHNNECFEIKEIELVSWKENDKTKYGIDFGHNLVPSISHQHFNYLKKLNSTNFLRAIKYIKNKVVFENVLILEYEKDNLHFYDQKLRLHPRCKIPDSIIIAQNQLINNYIKEFSFLNNVELSVSPDYVHFVIEDTPFNRLRYDKLNIELENTLLELIDNYYSTRQS